MMLHIRGVLDCAKTASANVTNAKVHNRQKIDRLIILKVRLS